jgi:hypothetical protein
MRKLTVFLVAGALLLGGFVYFINLALLPRGASYCTENARHEFPALIDSGIVDKRMWTRSLRNHWVAAIVVSPKSIDDTVQTTIVCHFKSTNFEFDRTELFPGNRVNAVKRISVSHLDPLMIFEDWGYSGRF